MPLSAKKVMFFAFTGLFVSRITQKVVGEFSRKKFCDSNG